MEELSINRPLKASRSGRLLIPRLKYWTGERVVVGKRGGVVDILGGVPDCTSTFQSERTLFKTSQSTTLSHTLNLDKSPEFPQMKATRSFSEYESVKSFHTRNIPKGKLVTRNRNIDNIPKVTKQKKNVRQRKHSLSKISEVVTNAISLPNKSSTMKVEKCHQEAKIKSKSRTPSPRKHLRKIRCSEKDEAVDIYGPEFQPVVRLVRLLPEEILSLTMRNTVEVIDKQPKRRIMPNRRKPTNSPKLQKSPKLEKSPKKRRVAKPKTGDENVNKGAKLSNHHHPRTVRETQQLLRILNQSKENEEGGDEAASTAAFFLYSPCRGATKQLNDAVDILNDDFESDDNLSIRMLSERESSPMSSAVSPIGSVYETDAEMSGREDCLLRGSPTLGNPSSFQRARLLHKTLKDRAKLLKKAKADENDDLFCLPSSQLTKGTDTTLGSQLLQPQAMRALEKDLKKKAKNNRQFDFSALYRGNLLHVSVNSDSDSGESTGVDSLDEF